MREGQQLETVERNYFDAIVDLTAKQTDYENGLKHLSEYLARHHQRRAVLLIDEYDTPIQAGYVHGYYDEIVGFMRNLLSGGFKDNSALEKGVLTGIMRVAKESIFSGLNNLDVYTLLSYSFADKFGLTEAEVKRLLEDFGLQASYDDVRQWYNGYNFGGEVIYNPWSIINFANKPREGCKPYWVNTSDNALIERLLTRGGSELKAELESLMRGEGIEKLVEENIVFRDIERKDDLLWSFLLFSGYLKSLSSRHDENTEKSYCRLTIPNREVRSLYLGIIEHWFAERLENRQMQNMLQALLEENYETFEEIFADFVSNSFSYWDAAGRNAEKVYQAFTLGLLVWLSMRYEVKSNRESGYGRYDVMLIPKDLRASGLIIEFKQVNLKRRETKEQAFAKAFQQIEEKNYVAELQQRGVEQVRKLAIVFKGKQVWVKEHGAWSEEQKAKSKKQGASGKRQSTKRKTQRAKIKS